MEPVSPAQDLHYDSIPHSNARQHRVDPRYPLHYQTGQEWYANGQTIPADDVARRTTSRRRKPSGSGGGGMGVAMPAAPDVPRSSRGGPPVSYRDPYSTDSAPPQDSSIRSFSARAAAQPNAFDTSFAAYNASEALPPAEDRKPSRRISTGHAAPITYPTVQKPPQPMYSEDPEPPTKRMGEVTRSKPRVASREETGNNRDNGEDFAQPKRSNTACSSTGEKTDWASDRSPLQRLEVKLNDISKEEKRARVMQAEARLRDSKSGTPGRRVSQGLDPGASRSTSKRVVSEGEGQRRSSRIPDHQTQGVMPGQPRYGSETLDHSTSTRDPATDRRRSSAGQPGKLQKAPPPEIADRLGYTPQRKPVDVGRNDSRAVRFQNQGAGDDAAYQGYEQGPTGPRGSGDAKAHLANDRLASSKHDSKYNDESDPVPREAVLSHGHGPKYKIPPQSAAGVEARQRIGFGDRMDDPADAMAHRSHHFSSLLHGRHGQQQQDPTVSDQPRHIDEWRQAGTAHLTLADANAPAAESPKTNKDQAWWENSVPLSQRRRSSVQNEITAFDGAQEDSNVPQVFTPPLYLKCGPLLRYTGMKRERPDQPNHRGRSSGRETWRGSVMIVTDDTQSTYKPVPTLRLFHQPMDLLPPPPQQYDGSNEEELQSEYVDPIAGLPKMTRTGGTVYVKPVEDLDEGKDVSVVENDDGLYEETRTANVPTSYGKADELLGRNPSTANKGKQKAPNKARRFKEVKGVRLHTERGVTFWRFNIEVDLGDQETRIAYKINQGTSIGFWVPAKGQTMNIMFHSCNGFSKSVDSNTFSGPDPLWRDVLNAHQLKPFHVMVGGGDQIYNDKVMDETEHFGAWLDIKNPHHKHEAEFSPVMQDELEMFYLERYCMWFSQGLFGMANSQIPMVNIWDDHDIIDGYGSYPDHFMSSKVFSGLGNVAFKYYMLFQHQSVVNETEADEPSWLLGSSPGPYINELNRSVFMSLGGRAALLGIDCRTERTRDEILSESSYDLIFDRCSREIIKGETRHLVVLLGVPIAYPRLVWLENILTSRALDPLKALGRMGLLGNVMNKFDGGVEILDDLDDHWTARNHKDERNWFIEELQHLAAEKSVRITILGGDVHLAAVGQFYSNKNLKIRKDRDHRYMPNIISSAIVNTPPPDMMADVLNKRNKIHHLNHETDEDMIPMFTHDVDGKPRNNKRLLPKRNWCSITEYMPGSTPPSTPTTLSPTVSETSLPQKSSGPLQRTLSLTRGDSRPAKLIRRLSLSNREPESYIDKSPSPPVQRDPPQMVSAPIPIRPVSQFHRRPTNLSVKAAAKGGGDDDGHIDLEFGLDIKINCEIKQGDPSGSTEGYRLLVPALFFDGDIAPHKPRKQNIIQRWNSRRISKSAAKQGEGNWGQSDSDSDSDSGADTEGDYTPDDFYGTNLARPNVVHQQAPPRASPASDIPKRSISLLHKRPPPFKMRPKPDSAERQPSPLRDFPPISAPIPQTPNQQAAHGLKSPPFKQNTTAPLGSDGDYDDTEDEEIEGPPKRRVGSKFDNSGVSKFFGGTPGEETPPSGGGGIRAKMGLGRSNSLPSPAQGMESGGYSGIEAYNGEKKGWRRFF